MRMLFETRLDTLRGARRVDLAEATEKLFPSRADHDVVYAWCVRSGLLRPEEDPIAVESAA